MTLIVYKVNKIICRKIGQGEGLFLPNCAEGGSIQVINRMTWIYIIIAIIAGPIVTNLLASLPTPWTNGTADTWITFFGNFSGGIIGGLVAYIIAKTQIEKQSGIENRNRFIAQLPALIKIKQELVRMRVELSNAEKMCEENKCRGDFRSACYLINGINEDYWRNLDLITNIKIQAELLKIKEFYTDFNRALTSDLNCLALKLEQIDLAIEQIIKHLHSRLIAGNQEIMEKRIKLLSLQDERPRLVIEQKKIRTDKEFFWELFLKVDFHDKVKKCIRNVEELINEIENP